MGKTKTPCYPRAGAELLTRDALMSRVNFASFYDDQRYRAFKRYLFNYQLRRRKIGAYLRDPRSPVLDVGCGIAPMAPDGMPVLLGDKSFAAMLAMSADGHRGAVLDLTDLGLRTASLGTVICSEVLEHLEQDQLALQELFRVLRPGGQLLLTVPLHAYFWGQDDEIVGHFRRYELAQLASRLTDLGFTEVKDGKVGSLFERLATLIVTVVFLQIEGSLPTGGGRFLRGFAWANWALAHVLGAASQVSPAALNSVGLITARKP
jgi:SAM-dependent methyltransferase